MRKIYVLMAVAAIAMVGCKNNGGKKAAAPAEAEEAPAAVSESMNKAIEAIEAAEEVDAREAIEKLAAAQSEGLVESVAEILEKNPDAVIPFAAVENKPGFNGGDANDFSKWVSENIQYPQDAIDSKIEGRVILQFTVSKEGDVKDVEVLRGVNELLDAEAVRVVSASPKWEAGSQNGVPVAVKYTFPVIFRLN
ncbi:MAG: energy transducer TonB [Candidatus Cryptobacteroides sp.]|jgi:protein TonB|nr:energy transducer TonB [Candidatus Cryptobacteroides sp.]